MPQLVEPWCSNRRIRRLITKRAITSSGLGYKWLQCLCTNMPVVSWTTDTKNATQMVFHFTLTGMAVAWWLRARETKRRVKKPSENSMPLTDDRLGPGAAEDTISYGRDASRREEWPKGICWNTSRTTTTTDNTLKRKRTEYLPGRVEHARSVGGAVGDGSGSGGGGGVGGSGGGDW